MDRLGRTVGELRRLAGTSRDDFGGLSGEAFRQHASGSAEGVARLAARVALLAIGLVALGRELEVAERLRAEGRPAQATASEERAQDHWRAAVARYDGEPGSLTPVVPGPVVEPSSPPTAASTAQPLPQSASPVVAPAPTSSLPSAGAGAATHPDPVEPEPALVSELVEPALESELVDRRWWSPSWWSRRWSPSWWGPTRRVPSAR